MSGGRATARIHVLCLIALAVRPAPVVAAFEIVWPDARSAAMVAAAPELPAATVTRATRWNVRCSGGELYGLPQAAGGTLAVGAGFGRNIISLDTSFLGSDLYAERALGISIARLVSRPRKQIPREDHTRGRVRERERPGDTRIARSAACPHLRSAQARCGDDRRGDPCRAGLRPVSGRRDRGGRRSDVPGARRIGGEAGETRVWAGIRCTGGGQQSRPPPSARRSCLAVASRTGGELLCDDLISILSGPAAASRSSGAG